MANETPLPLRGISPWEDLIREMNPSAALRHLPLGRFVMANETPLPLRGISPWEDLLWRMKPLYRFAASPLGKICYGE